MSKILGDAVIKVDGAVFKTLEGSGRLQTGGKQGTTRKGGGQIHGRSQTTMESQVTADLVVDENFDSLAIADINDATIEFSDADGGPAWVISRAWFIEMGEIEEGSESKVSVTFQGVPAQPVGSSVA